MLKPYSNRVPLVRLFAYVLSPKNMSNVMLSFGQTYPLKNGVEGDIDFFLP